MTNGLLQDLRQTLRTLAKSRGFTAVAVLTLALGIGTSTAIFSLLNAVLLRSLPYGDAGRLVNIYTPNRRVAPDLPVEAFGPTSADFFDLARETRSFSSLAMFDLGPVAIVSHDLAQRVGGARVSAGFFETLQVPMAIGRAIQPEDDRPGHERVAVISHVLWQSGFDGDPGILDRTLTLNGQPFQIVGVGPAGFRFPQPVETAYDASEPTDVWTPLALTPEQAADRTLDSIHNAIGRLRPRVTLAEAQIDTSAIVARLDPLHEPDLQGWSASLASLAAAASGGARPVLEVLAGAVALLLLIACTNAASLLLSRSLSRRQELGVRAALGASRGRLVRHVLVEACVLSGIAGLLGVALAHGLIRGLLQLDPGNIPRLAETAIDGPVLLVGLGLSIATGLAFGGLPAWIVSRADIDLVLRRAGAAGRTPSSQRLSRALIAAQVAVAVVLLAGAGLLVRSYAAVRQVDTGFSTTTQTMRVSLDERYANTGERRRFYRALIDRVTELPGVRAAGAIDALPLSHTERMSFFEVQGYANRAGQLVDARAVTGGYFQAMGLAVVEGRPIGDGDVGSRPRVVVVNRAFARAYLPVGRAVGARFRYGGLPGSDDRDSGPWFTIVGVVADVRHASLEAAPAPQVYESLWQSDADGVYLTVRADGAVELVGAIRQVVKGLDPILAVANMRRMDERLSEAIARRRFQTVLFSLFGAAALALAAVGLSGSLWSFVRQRVPEIGIRAALGATRGDIVRLVLREGLGVAAGGLVLGLAGAVALTRVLSAWLYEVTPTDPPAFIASAAVLLAASLLACAVPIVRATRVDPVSALRAE